MYIKNIILIYVIYDLYMDLKQLLYFKTVVEEGSISRAAQKLFMAQPPLSMQMKLLEQELNCKLFDRGSRNISLTNQGKLLYSRAITILELSQLTINEITNKDQKHTLRIGVVSSISESLAKELISSYCNKRVDVDIELYEHNTYELLDLLNNGVIHLAFIRTPHQKIPYKQIELAKEKLVCYGYKDYFKNNKIDKKQLEKLPVLTYRRWKDILSSKMNLNFHLLADNAHTIIEYANNKMGVAIVPSSAITKIHHDFKKVEISDLNIETGVNLIYKENINDDIENDFIEFINDTNVF